MTLMDLVAESEKLQCALEAIAAHGDTAATEQWYRRWMPERFARVGLVTTVQYSLSCFLMDHAHRLLTADCCDPANGYHSTPHVGCIMR